MTVVAGGVITLLERTYCHAQVLANCLSRVTLWPVILLFIPKINLINIGGGETAGIRLDDVVLFIVALVLLASTVANLRLRADPVPAFGFGMIGIFCLSNLVNSEHSNVLYSLRLVEYLVFFWAGKSLVRSGRSVSTLARMLIAVNGIFIALQFVGVIGGFTAEGYKGSLERPFGISTNHPAEMGALLNLLFATFAFDDEDRSSASFWRWSLLTAGVVFITGSRSALICHCVLTLIYVYRHATNKTGFILKSALVTGTLAAVVILAPNSARERSADLFSPQNIDAARQLYDTLPAERSFTGYAAGSEAEDAPQDVDASLYMRVFKWIYVAKIMFTAPRTVWILGLGPGALGPALDGGWLRLVAEAGVAGTFAFVLLMRKIWNVSWSCAMAVLALGINMVMVDSQFAYKVMAFLFLLAGAEVQKQLQEYVRAIRPGSRLVSGPSTPAPES